VNQDIIISIIIVNYKVSDYLKRLLLSLQDAEYYNKSEVIIVDNASRDNSKEKITKEFPHVKWIELKNNIGFGKACNVGAKIALGKYLLFLNPDTLVSKNTLSVCLDFFSKHTDAGIMGPKILNPDGTLQHGCKRSFPSPMVAFYRFSGLSLLFPKSQRFGKYNLTYLDPDKPSKVDAVSGSFMFIPKDLFWEIGGFDERFFMYGEDLDLCSRVREKGKTVWYNPETKIIHFKGRSAEKHIWKSRKAFYEAMIIFSQKYKNTNKTFLPNWLIIFGIAIQGLINFTGKIFKTFMACFIDFIIINLILWFMISIRFYLSSMVSPYFSSNMPTMLFMHLLISLCFIAIFFYRGVYSKERYSFSNVLISGFIASLIFMSLVFFIKSMAFSRISFGIASILIVFTLGGWRIIFPKAISSLKKFIYSTGNVIILGSGEICSILIKNFEEDPTANIKGIVWPSKENIPGEFEGYPILGNLENLKEILIKDKIDLLLIATEQPWYSYLIDALSSAKIKNITIQWVPTELFDKPKSSLPKIIPLKDFSV
jgi:GT2 family glycosyltransferase